MIEEINRRGGMGSNGRRLPSNISFGMGALKHLVAKSRASKGIK